MLRRNGSLLLFLATLPLQQLLLRWLLDLDTVRLQTLPQCLLLFVIALLLGLGWGLVCDRVVAHLYKEK